MKNMDKESSFFEARIYVTCMGPNITTRRIIFVIVESRVFLSPCANYLCGKLTDIIREQTNTVRDEIDR